MLHVRRMAPGGSSAQAQALELWDNVKAALIGVASSRIKQYIGEFVPGFDDPLSARRAAGGGGQSGDARNLDGPPEPAASWPSTARRVQESASIPRANLNIHDKEMTWLRPEPYTTHSSRTARHLRRRTAAHEGAGEAGQGRTSPHLRQRSRRISRRRSGHVERLEQVFESLDEKVRGKHCDGIAGIIEEGKAIMEEDFDEATMDACLIAAGQRAEHYEMAAYGTLVAWARAMGHDEAADLLQETLDEEKAADEKLSGARRRRNQSIGRGCRSASGR